MYPIFWATLNGDLQDKEFMGESLFQLSDFNLLKADSASGPNFYVPALPEMKVKLINYLP